MKALLEVQRITRKFSGVTALDQVSMELHPGKVTALIGENGAGKSTLLKILSGVYTPDEGHVIFKGREVRFTQPKEAQDEGISIIHQELNLIPNLTVMQNIFLGRELMDRFGLLDEKKMFQQTRELLNRVQLEVAPNALVGALKVGQQQLVEIAKALLVEADVLFMDEPTSAIGESEVEVLFQIIRQLKAAGKSIVYISHKLEELFALADEYVVLRDGKIVGRGEMNTINREALIELMAGRKVAVEKWTKKGTGGEAVLQVKDLRINNPQQPGRPFVRDVCFELRKGEVLGVYGLMGAGRTELFEGLFGLKTTQLAGEVCLDGGKVHFSAPADAIRNGLALVPEDRKQAGIVPQMSVAGNMSLADISKIEKAGLLSKLLESELYTKHVKALNIKVDTAQQWIQNLSGGNQQKVVLAKWMERNPKVLLLDEPTRGIDINAKNEIYQLIADLATSGCSVLIASSEIPEILAVAHRILVMAEGKVTATFDREEATESKIMSACIPEPIDP